MSRNKASVTDYMTPSPISVNIADNLSVALDKMTKQGIRHLPVVDAGKLVGIISERDLRLGRTMRGNVDTLKVEDVVEDDVYVAGRDASLKDVAYDMVTRKIGSAVVVEDGRPVGIFTTTDACRALIELLS